jgi:hypothetical protein
MRQQDDERDLMRGYLLGSLDGERLEQVEVRLLSDSQFQVELQQAQDELIDDYAFGVLSGSERESFEQHFLLTPERADKLRFARAMNEHLGERLGQEDEGGSAASWWQRLSHPLAGRKLRVGFAIAASLMTIVALAFILLELRNTRVTREQAMRASIEREVALWTRNPPVNDKDNRIAKLSLTPGALRESVGARRVSITDDSLAAQLRLLLVGQRFDSYEAILLTDEDRVVFTVGSLVPEENDGETVLILRIPAKYLPNGDYQLKLRGTMANGQTTDAGSYSFQVIHKSASP